MSEIDEGLDEIFHDKSIKMGGELLVPYWRWDSTKQAILDLMCKHRGCEPEPPETEWPRYSFDEAPWEVEGSCKWCGKEQP